MEGDGWWGQPNNSELVECGRTGGLEMNNVVEAGELEFQGDPWFLRESRGSLSYIGCCLIK